MAARRSTRCGGVWTGPVVLVSRTGLPPARPSGGDVSEVPVTVTEGGRGGAGGDVGDVSSGGAGGGVVPGLPGPNGAGGGRFLACSCSESCCCSASIFCSTSDRLCALGELLR